MRTVNQFRLVIVWIVWLISVPSAWSQAYSSSIAPEKIIRAVQFDDIDTVRNFAEQHGDVNLAEPDRGETLLMISVRERSQRVLEFLIQHPKIQLDQRARNGDTAIMLAAYLEQKDIVQRLIEAGAQVNQQGWTALHYAAIVGNLDIVTLLIAHYAYIDAETPNKTTPLMLAARSGEIRLVQFLIDEGADISLKNMLGWTAYDFAMESERRDVAHLLQEKMTPKK